MCNAYYIIIIAELRQAFFGDFFIFSDVAWEKPKEGPIIIPLYK